MSYSTNQQIPPSQPAVPEGYELKPKKKPVYKRVWFWLLIIVLLIVIIAVSASGGGSSSSGGNASGGSAKSAGLNQAVRDGKFEFTVSGVDCSKSTLGTEPITTKANGVFCVVSLHVTNIGNEAQTLDATSQYGYDAQNKKYSTDTAAEIYLGDTANTLFNQLNPGTSVDGQIVYDVPATTKLTKIELHDSAFSDGVAVNLG